MGTSRSQTIEGLSSRCFSGKTAKHDFKSVGKVVPLKDWDYSNAIILRHDVDLDIMAAHRLALIEKENGVRSTFFILTTCMTYNPLSAENRGMLSEMSEWGFEIGLHFDPMLYAGCGREQLKEKVDMEAQILTSVTDKSVYSISLHNPSVHGQYPIFEKYRNAYDKRIFSDRCYLSDSCMDFRGKDPYEFAEQVKDFPLQILLHPLHYSEHKEKYPDIICKVLHKYIDGVDQAMRVNRAYAKAMSTTDLFAYIIQRERTA